jgi:hypothetical protein
LQARKLAFIDQFLRLQNEDAIERLEALLNSLFPQDSSENVTRLTVEELEKRIAKSLQDSENHRLKSIEDLKKEVSSWD